MFLSFPLKILVISLTKYKLAFTETNQLDTNYVMLKSFLSVLVIQ